MGGACPFRVRCTWNLVQVRIMVCCGFHCDQVCIDTPSTTCEEAPVKLSMDIGRTVVAKAVTAAGSNKAKRIFRGVETLIKNSDARPQYSVATDTFQLSGPCYVKLGLVLMRATHHV